MIHPSRRYSSANPAANRVSSIYESRTGSSTTNVKRSLPKPTFRLNSSVKKRPPSVKQTLRQIILKYHYKGTAPDTLPEQSVYDSGLDQSSSCQRSIFIKIIGGSIQKQKHKLDSLCGSFLRYLQEERSRIHLKLLSGEIDYLKGCIEKSSLRTSGCLSKSTQILSFEGFPELRRMTAECQALRQMVNMVESLPERMKKCNSSEKQLARGQKQLRQELYRLLSAQSLLSVPYWGEVRRRVLQKARKIGQQERTVHRLIDEARCLVKELQSIRQCGTEEFIEKLVVLERNREESDKIVEYLNNLDVGMHYQQGFIELTQLVHRIRICADDASSHVQQVLQAASEEFAEVLSENVRVANLDKFNIPDRYARLLRSVISLSNNKESLWSFQVDCHNLIAMLTEVQSYSQRAPLMAKAVMDQLQRPIIIDDPRYVTELVAQYQILVQCSTEALKLVCKSSSPEISHDVGRLQQLVQLSSQLLDMSKLPEMRELTTHLRQAASRRLRLPNRKNPSSMPGLVEQLLALKKKVQAVRMKLGQLLLHIEYSNEFIRRVEAIKPLLEEYSWKPKSSFEPEAAIKFLRAARQSISCTAFMMALQWNIVKELIIVIPFRHIPRDLANITDYEYQLFCQQLDWNRQLHSQANLLLEESQHCQESIRRRIVNRLGKLMAEFNRMDVLHETYQSIETPDINSKRSVEIRQQLSVLFGHIFFSHNATAISACFQQLQQVVGQYEAMTPRSGFIISKRDPLLARLRDRVSKEKDQQIQQMLLIKSAIKQNIGSNNTKVLSTYYRSLCNLLGENTLSQKETMTESLREGLRLRIKMLINVCLRYFGLPQLQQCNKELRQIVTQDHAILLLGDIESACRTIGRINSHFVEEISHQVCYPMFCEDSSTHIADFYAFVKNAELAVQAAVKLSGLVKGAIQLECLIKKLQKIHQMVGEVALETSSRWACRIVHSICSQFRPASDSWWKLRCRNHDLDLYCAATLDKIKGFLVRLIRQIVPDLPNQDISRVMEQTVSVNYSTRVLQISSVSQFNIADNRHLQIKLQFALDMSEYEQICLRVYWQLWRELIWQDDNQSLKNTLREYSYYVRRTLEENAKHLTEIQSQPYIILFQADINEYCQTIKQDLQFLADIDLLESATLETIDFFSRGLRRMKCPSLSHFKDIRDFESGLNYFMYPQEKRPEDYVNKALLLLFNPDTRKEIFERNEHLLLWWSSLTLTLQHRSHSEVLAQLNSYYDIKRMRPPNDCKVSTQDQIKYVVERITEPSLIAVSELKSRTISEMAQLFGTLHTAISEQAASRWAWLREFRNCLRQCHGDLTLLKQWFKQSRQYCEGRTQRLTQGYLKLTARIVQLVIPGEVSFLITPSEEIVSCAVVRCEVEPVFVLIEAFFRFHRCDNVIFEDYDAFRKAIQYQSNGNFLLSPLKLTIVTPDCGRYRLQIGSDPWYVTYSSGIELQLAIGQVDALQLRLIGRQNKTIFSTSQKCVRGGQLFFPELAEWLEQKKLEEPSEPSQQQQPEERENTELKTICPQAEQAD